MSIANMMLPSARVVDLCNLNHGDIRLYDIAVGLAHAMRWRGAMGAYTVAQHSVLASLHAEVAHEREAQAAALLHDAAEAIMGDVPTPVKDAVQSNSWENVEDDLTIHIAKQYGVELLDHWDSVRDADHDLAEWEIAAIGARVNPLIRAAIENETIPGWSRGMRKIKLEVPDVHRFPLYHEFEGDGARAIRDLRRVWPIREAQRRWLIRAEQLGLSDND